MANEAELADHSRTTRFDHSSTLPRKKSLASFDACSLYFLSGAGLIKIGITTNLVGRIRSIRNASPVPLTLLATMAGTSFHEGDLHYRFAHLRRHGEWFEDNGEIVEEIKARLRIPYWRAKVPTESPLFAE